MPTPGEVAALVTRDGMKVYHVPLRYAGSTSQFAAKLDVAEPGAYEIAVYAYDPANGNTGVDKTTIVVSGSRFKHQVALTPVGKGVHASGNHR